MKALKIFVFAKSLGGVTSLAESPTEMSQSFVPNQIKDHYSLTENLVRLSIGNEDLDDLI